MEPAAVRRHCHADTAIPGGCNGSLSTALAAGDPAPHSAFDLGVRRLALIACRIFRTDFRSLAAPATVRRVVFLTQHSGCEL